MRPDAPAGWVIWPDQQVTRRKRFHILTDPSGEIRFRNYRLEAVVDWLKAENIDTFTLFWPDSPPLAVRCLTTA